MADETFWVGLTSALAWPVTTLAALFVYRESLRGFFTALTGSLGAGRQVKLAAASISIEVGAARTETVANVAPITDIPFAAEANIFASAGSTYFRALIEGDSVDAVTINLGSGQQFLTSRLFATVALMARQRDLVAVAFVETRGVREEVYLGTCLADDLRRALESRFPEYEAALAMALHQLWWARSPEVPAVVLAPGTWPMPPASELPLPSLDVRGRLPATVASVVVGGFLEALQYRDPAGAPATSPAPPGWVWLAGPGLNVYERAEWVTAQWLRDRLGPTLNEIRVTREGDAPGTLVERVVRGDGSYVGLVDDAGRLQELISRTKLLEKVSRASASGSARPANGSETDP